MFHSMHLIRPDEFDNYLEVKYSPPWASGKQYSVHDLVKHYDSKDETINVYFCNTAHTSTSVFDKSKFTKLPRDFYSKGFWDTWEDWHLIPSSRPVFKSPKMIKRTIEIPGRDGVLDLSDTFSDRVLYENSEGSFDFYVDNDWENWEVLNEKILNIVHGNTMLCIFEDDPGYFRKGRFTVNEWKSEPKNSKVVLDYSVDPYKHAIAASDEDYYWDAIDFETDFFRDCSDINISDGNVVYTRLIDSTTFTRSYLDFYGSRQPTKAIVSCRSSSSLKMTVKKLQKDIYGNITEIVTVPTFDLTANTSKSFELQDFSYRFYFTGSGRISINFREARL